MAFCPALVSPPVRWRGLGEAGEALSEVATHFPPSGPYSKKQRSLRLNSNWKGGSGGHGRTSRSQAGLAIFCQAAHLSGLSRAELACSLHGLHKAGAPRAGRGPAGLGTLSRDPLSELAAPFPPTGFLAPGARSAYSQILNLNGRTQSEFHTRNRTPRPDVRLPKSYQPSQPKRRPNRGRLSEGESRKRQGQRAGPVPADKGRAM